MVYLVVRLSDYKIMTLASIENIKQAAADGGPCFSPSKRALGFIYIRYGSKIEGVHAKIE